MDLSQLIDIALYHQASDIHLSSDVAPLFRIHGQLRCLGHQKMTSEMIAALIDSVMTSDDKRMNEFDWDTAFTIKGQRIRANIFKQQRGRSVALRLIHHRSLNLNELGLPKISQQFCQYKTGLVLISGATGSGKSTTMAGFIQMINQSQQKHILTIEDPIEFIFENAQCLIQQRELKRDVMSFEQALRAGMRQDPDIIMIGELRDHETIRLALNAAETGHLVFATLHASSVITTLDRICQWFRSDEQESVRKQLAHVLRAVVSQQLIDDKAGSRVLACEIMVMNPAIQHLIRENRLNQIYSVLQTGQAQGMQTHEQSLAALRAQSIID